MRPSQNQVDPHAVMREELRNENLILLQTEITGKEIIIKTSTYRNNKERKYLVEEVKDEYFKDAGKLVRGIRLINNKTSKEEQPLLKYPSELIAMTTENKQKKLTLRYTSDVNFTRDFRRLCRDTKPDLEIYFYY
ncbi:hypothetical protein AUJ95_02050 [Candidatus Desantisbacteria bacterium CG2_30_40_21]|uniref:Uncharacterized protein n=5 Tax=unclassified Candidatus Desantisiibacteriota TaxID=3106372 RepID=A0A2M7JDB0_9BACT|nr:MAG: hypothetical protein AUJ95_02050 [Candidatus Desantisbacteria bacterium CG2_30_40_21]PIP40547.1 MAG: hypothetical protein COX18_06400 [Candidatus Desantisbacteria bacterium CG23_combo_of_CG06-09_8_20_14_all_40_23]PIX17412.1 MAG: hypothetical protein COZ71_03470 [Candidatus Desantisbacteria bacterium CG_4_8_14_3_um_filter_40_12]PIY18583.1 MAG: hypothetical protein COZ13_09850 [Candidatus Desantisbacteria bacterium CG_4_10_14_3_um_filter_40_18]PJB29632.1 MAG: hypothetical protein CO110_04